MATKKLVKRILLVVPVLILSGCYTAFNAPRVSSRPSEQDVWQSSESRSQQQTAEDDFYRYPGDIYDYGGDPYPYGGGTPYIGYSSSSGLYGYGSYGYNPYGYANAYGYGPYGYGADPYYVDNGGYYLPPGYELITTRELEEYRDTIHTLTSRPLDPVGDASREDFRRQREEERQEVFQSRLNPSRGRQVDAVPYVAPANPPSGGTSSGTVKKSSGGSSGGSSSKSSSSNSSTDIKSKSKRRRGR